MVEGIKSGHAEKPLPTFPVSASCLSSPHLNPASALKINDPDFPLRVSHDWRLTSMEWRLQSPHGAFVL